MNHQRSNMNAASTNYGGVLGRAQWNQKNNGNPVMITGEMGAFETFSVLAIIAENAAEIYGSIAWELKHGVEEAGEDVEVGTVTEKTEKRQINNLRKDSRDKMIQYVCKNYIDDDVKMTVENMERNYASSKSLVIFRALILKAVSSADATMDASDRFEKVQ